MTEDPLKIMKNKENISNLTKSYYEKTSNNVVAVGYSRKVKDGKLTKDTCLSFYVKKKKPINEINEADLVPKTVNIGGGEEIITDVVEVKNFSFFEQEFICGESGHYDANPPLNRGHFRPLRGGVSITNVSDLGDFVGTLGFLAIDSYTGGIVGVSNAHVLIYDHFNTSERSPVAQVKSSILQDYVVQPHPYDIGQDLDSAQDYRIGWVKRYVPMITSDYNQVDVALCTIDSGLLDQQSFKIEGLNYDLPMDFATTEEIDSLIGLDLDCYTSGRTSGPRGEGLHKLKVTSLITPVSILYDKQGVSTLVDMDDAIILQAIDENNNILDCPINSGDSGSVLIADFNGERKIIGVMYAGGSGVAAACRIDRVAEQIGISPWNGSLDRLKYSKSFSAKYLDAKTSDISFYETSSGKTYWQAGLVDAATQQSTPTPTPYVPSPNRTNDLFNISSFSSVPEPYYGYLVQAANRWMQYVQYNNTDIQDIRSYAGYENFNGMTLSEITIYTDLNVNTIASCGVSTYSYNDSHTKIISLAFRLNINEKYKDIYSPSSWIDIIAHELGHAIGVGQFWNPNASVSKSPPVDGFLQSSGYPICQNGYNTSASSGVYSQVPLVRTGGVGTYGSHWSDEAIDSSVSGSLGLSYPAPYEEIMVGYYSPSVPFKITPITLGAIKDFGYVSVSGSAPNGEGFSSMIDISGTVFDANGVKARKQQVIQDKIYFGDCCENYYKNMRTEILGYRFLK